VPSSTPHGESLTHDKRWWRDEHDQARVWEHEVSEERCGERSNDHHCGCRHPGTAAQIIWRSIMRRRVERVRDRVVRGPHEADVQSQATGGVQPDFADELRGACALFCGIWRVSREHHQGLFACHVGRVVTGDHLAAWGSGGPPPHRDDARSGAMCEPDSTPHGTRAGHPANHSDAAARLKNTDACASHVTDRHFGARPVGAGRRSRDGASGYQRDMSDAVPLANTITLGVQDLVRERDFYRELGWPIVFDSDDFIVFELRGTLLALFPLDKLAVDSRADPEPGRGGIRSAVIIQVDTPGAVDQLAERVQQAGGTLTKPPTDADFFVGRDAYFADPEHNYWEIAYAPSDNPVVVAARRAANIRP
jgi:uncharacterized protein